MGNIGKDGIHIDSLIPLLRNALIQAGIESAHLYSGHSLHRGFASWATANGWDLKTLMRYVECTDPFRQLRSPPLVIAG